MVRRVCTQKPKGGIQDAAQKHCEYRMKCSFPIFEWLIMAGPITLLVAILFTAAGGAKLIGNAGMVQEFAQIGIGQCSYMLAGQN